MSSVLKRIFKPVFNSIASIGLGLPHGMNDIELMVAGVKPVAIIYPHEVTPQMAQLIKEGEVVYIGGQNTSSKGKAITHVYAQKDMVEDGKEVHARMYLDGQGYEELSVDEGIARVGKLLGYTDNDVAWCLGTKYQNKPLIKLLERTADWRRELRKEMLLADAPRIDQ